jgi:hypothetical protein
VFDLKSTVRKELAYNDRKFWKISRRKHGEE